MPLEKLVKVLTDEDKNGVQSRIKIISLPKFNSESAEFLWGVIYEQYIPESDTLQTRTQLRTKTVIELVYGGLSGKLYLVRPASLEEIKSKPEVNAGEDIRYKRFGKEELYKAFFHLLNRDLKTGGISKEQYMDIYKTIGSGELPKQDTTVAQLIASYMSRALCKARQLL